MVQWLRIHLAMQRTPVRSLAQEDPTRHRAVEPMCPNDWAHTPQPPGPTHHNTKAHTHHNHQSPHTTTPKPTHHNTKAHTPQPPKSTHHNHQSPHTTTTKAHTPQPPKPTHHSHGCPRALSLSSTARDTTAVRSLHMATRGIPDSPQVGKTLHGSGDPVLLTVC